jgi:hypothetical protein
MPVKPSEHEEAYFARVELERRKKHEEARLKSLAAEEKKRLQALHYMRCPKCGMELSEIDYKGVKVDKCLSCDGIWLDAGELESIAALEKVTLDRLFVIFKR